MTYYNIIDIGAKIYNTGNKWVISTKNYEPVVFLEKKVYTKREFNRMAKDYESRLDTVETNEVALRGKLNAANNGLQIKSDKITQLEAKIEALQEVNKQLQGKLDAIAKLVD